ncbi:MAG TPA: hypothetical protein VHT21_03025 [Stellaceae bacterium]|nr:hypothetical protein [Stellaceae bacterium]
MAGLHGVILCFSKPSAATTISASTVSMVPATIEHAGLSQLDSGRFGSPLVLSRVHWVRPELVAEVKFLTWTEDNLLRQVVYEGLREDKPAADVRRAAPYPKPAEPKRPAAQAKRSRPS